MRMTLNDAARKLYDDPRRAHALRAEPAATAAARQAMDEISDTKDAIFDPYYCSVGGSVHRRTHLPGESDLDITLALSGATWSGPYRNAPFPATVQESLTVYAKRLGKALSADQSVCDAFAHMCNSTEPALIRRTLATTPHLKSWPDRALLVAKFTVNGVTVLEVGLGDIPWHYVGLRYNDVWEKQRNRLDQAQQEITLSQILLAKFLFKRRQLYGEKGRLPNLQPNSRRIEQFVMRLALKGSQCPLLDACRAVMSLNDHYDQVLPCFKIPEAAFPNGVTEAQLTHVNVTAESLKNWRAFRHLAADVASNSMDYGAELMA